MSILKQAATKDIFTIEKQRNYNEIVEYLDSHWSIPVNTAQSLERVKMLDKAFDHAAQKLKTIFIGGSNGKSLTAHFTAKLMKEEGISVGIFYAPHIINYNERFSIDNETISNKLFTDIANEVINTAESLHLEAHTYEILSQMAFNYFIKNKINVAIFEMNRACTMESLTFCVPSIIAITRLTGKECDSTGKASVNMMNEYLTFAKKDVHIVSADQNKENLKYINTYANNVGAIWAMPIRKLITLSYPFEQLHGRCASLAERIVSIYINSCMPNTMNDSNSIFNTSLLAKQQGQRGRPTLEAKRTQTLHPKRTLEHFWKETVSDLPARFQILNKEKPSIIIDMANNIDALKNLLLGIRLMHYQQQLKGLTLVVGYSQEIVEDQEFSKLIRYFFKKTSGQIVICPTKNMAEDQHVSWNVDNVTNDLLTFKVKAKAAYSFKEGFEYAKKSVNERNGLIVIAGTTSFINEYWINKGTKKLN